MPKKYRAIETKTLANKEKQELVAGLLPTWVKGLTLVAEIQEAKIRQGERVGWLKNSDYPDSKPPSYLKARQWKNIANQVNSSLHSWKASIIKRVRPHIFGLDVSEKERKKLFKMNLAGEWYQDERLAVIVDTLLEDHPYPSFESTRTMLMDGLIAPIQETRKGTVFQEWVRITLPDRSPVYLPLVENPYLESQPGEPKTIQIKVLRDNSVTLRVVKVTEYDEPIVDTDAEIGLDWGLKNLLTTSSGRLYGSQLYSWLVEVDEILVKLVKNLQKNGFKKLNRSKRYRRLNHRIREYVTNEVGRIVNLIGEEELKYITVEDLDFRGGGLSRRLNRIITRAGRKVLKNRLAEQSEETGVEIVTVPAYYSSQECAPCGYVDRRNRASQSIFKCKFCGFKSHADVNAGRVMKGRRSIPSFASVASKEDALEVLDQRFSQKWGLSFDQYQERSTPRPCSRASSTQLVAT